jgi:hypothetical protein
VIVQVWRTPSVRNVKKPKRKKKSKNDAREKSENRNRHPAMQALLLL